MKLIPIFIFLFSIHSLAQKKSCPQKIETVIVNGDSMAPLLKNKQEVRVDLNYYNCHSIAKGDIIIFEIPGRKNRLIKKVFAIPGDKYEYKNKKIIINGKVISNSKNEKYQIQSPMLKLFSDSYPIVPKNSYLVLGDQPQGSFDASRMGFIDLGQIQGKVLFR